ncbi:SagB family peptide dehydrogenase, partial [Halobacillus sp. BBL2006]|uniref:SagB family peptide dehydrogenase n=1 Tax=Halobacillus sp. BBL2006 TaxID=1543706 RepID=UPI000541A452
MDIDVFLHHLHFQSELVTPDNWEVDWDDAPLPYKVYRNLPGFPLDADIPLSFQDPSFSPEPNRKTISHFLWYVFGLSQFSQTALPSPMDGESFEIIQSFRRFSPSGGALYPNELYIYLKLGDLPHGLYHYDVAHHRLLLLREGDFDIYISDALGNPSAMSDCFGAVLLTTMFWKNFFKYNNFSYRLQGLDAGAVIGQLLEVNRRFRFSSKVHFQFLDQALNHLLGLDDQEENTYAVIPLSDCKTFPAHEAKVKEISALELCKEIPYIKTVHYQRSKNVLSFPEILRVNQAAKFDSTVLFHHLEDRKEENVGKPVYVLPEVKNENDNFALNCRNRYSPEMDFISKRVELVQLASLLKQAVDSFSFDNDLDKTKGQLPRVSIYGCFYNVEGIPNGAYQYDASSHSLLQIKEGDLRLTLQGGMTLDNVNLHQVPMSFHIVGDRTHFKAELGY